MARGWLRTSPGSSKRTPWGTKGSRAVRLGRIFTIAHADMSLRARRDSLFSHAVRRIYDRTLTFGHANMIEPPELVEARTRLSRAEARLFGKTAAVELEAGLSLLQEIVESGDGHVSLLARNIAKAYASKIYDTIRNLLASDRNIPEPTLEHSLRLVLAFDAVDVDLPVDARAVKVDLGRQLLNRYLEGHAAEEKRAALEELLKIAEGRTT